LILDVVQDQKLIEKYGKQEGLNINVDWDSISGSAAMNEALLAGALDVVRPVCRPCLTLWDRTRGRQNVKAIASLGSMPSFAATQRCLCRPVGKQADYSSEVQNQASRCGNGSCASPRNRFSGKLPGT